jgi:5-formyltetrahydrofolate cyclo-ligase
MAVPSPTKAEMRARMRELRADHFEARSLPERCAAAASVAETVLPLIEDAPVVAVYLPIGAEVDVLPLIAALEARGVALALPHYAGLRVEPKFFIWKPGDALVAGPMGLRQPDPATAEPAAPDAFIVPLLAFDASRARLGYGAGYYDRAFAAHPEAKRIGVSWACQQMPAVPTDNWDMPLHAVVTEDGIAA